MEDKKSFWKVNLFSLFLAFNLVVLVGVNLNNTWQAQVDLVDEINTLKWTLGSARMEVAALRIENKILIKEALKWLTIFRGAQHFMSSMYGEMSSLHRFSRCVNCCYVAAKIIKMGYRFAYFKKMIQHFESF